MSKKVRKYPPFLSLAEFKEEFCNTKEDPKSRNHRVLLAQENKVNISAVYLYEKVRQTLLAFENKVNISEVYLHGKVRLRSLWITCVEIIAKH